MTLQTWFNEITYNCMNRGENILVWGMGGREEALRWNLEKQRTHGSVYGAPGNGRTHLDGMGFKNISQDPEQVARLCHQLGVGLLVLGPDDVVAAGWGDILPELGIPTFGPSFAAAELERDKIEAEYFEHKYNIPHAHGQPFYQGQAKDALQYIYDNLDRRKVIKYPYLARGKGVIVPQYKSIDQYLQQSEQALDQIMQQHQFGPKGDVLIQDYVDGREASVIALVSGQQYKILPIAQDYKELNGLNTGGMGCFAPSPFVTPEILDQVEQSILKPTLAGLALGGHPYNGALYMGIKITPQGPVLFEYNCRFGDPETQVQMVLSPNLESALNSCIDGTLDQVEINFLNQAAVCVVLAAQGYPQNPVLGDQIYNLDKFNNHSNIHIFHAGTRLSEKNVLVDGGRALNIVGVGSNFHIARAFAHLAIGEQGIHFRDMQYLTNIAEGI